MAMLSTILHFGIFASTQDTYHAAVMSDFTCMKDCLLESCDHVLFSSIKEDARYGSLLGIYSLYGGCTPECVGDRQFC